VLGKGSKERLVPIGREATRELRKYLGDRRSGWLFPGRDGQPLGTRRLEYLVEECARIDGVSGKRCSPHTFRHTSPGNLSLMAATLSACSRYWGTTACKWSGSM